MFAEPDNRDASFIETRRLILRTFTQADIEDLQTVMESTPVAESALPVDQARLFIERTLASYRHRGFGVWALESKCSADVIGYCGYIYQNIKGWGQVELVYRVKRSLWGRGLATEAVMAACDYAASQLKLKRLTALIEPDNSASIRVVRKAGFVYRECLDLHNIKQHIYTLEFTSE